MGSMIISVSNRGVYYVEDESGTKIAGPFESNAAAWRYIDRISNEPVSIAEKKSDWAWNRGINKGL